MSTKNKIIPSTKKTKQPKTSKIAVDSYATSLQLTRYKLNQFYQSKFNEKRVKGELDYENKSPKHQSTYFLKDSFLLEKLTSRKDKEDSFINSNKPYKFERDLFDNQYHERIKAFNERRKKAMIDFNINYSLSESMNKLNTSNKKQVSPDSCKVPMSYYRSNLTTEIPERKNQVTEQCSVCGSKIEKNEISQMSCDKTVSVSDNSLYRKSYL